MRWNRAAVRPEMPVAVRTLLGAVPINTGSITDPPGCPEYHSQHHGITAERLRVEQDGQP